MNRDDIIRWAHEAGAYEPTNKDDWAFELVDLERFANFVAADRDALRHRVRELEEAMRLCGIDHSSLVRIATAIRGSAL